MVAPRLISVVALSSVGMAAVVASAQENGTPVFMSPDRGFESVEVGGSISVPKDADLAIEGFASVASGRNDFGLRIGVRSWGSGADALVGAHVRNRFVHHSADFPFDMALTLGVGTWLGDSEDGFQVPVGMSIGRRFRIQDSTASFIPYVHPVVVPISIRGHLRWDVAVGFGLDISVNRRIDLRVSGGLGDIQGVSFSLVWLK